MSKARDIADLNVTILDSVESGATADQTNAEIRAAVEAATDSNVFTDADHTKLNSTVATVVGTETLTNKTLTAPDINTPDIDGGTIDGAVIGGATAAAISGTTGTFSSTVRAVGTTLTSASSATLAFTGTTSRLESRGADVSTRGAIELMQATSNGSSEIVGLGIDAAGAATFNSSISIAGGGSIGVANSDLHIGSNGDQSGLRFQATSVMPRKNGADANGTVDLGLASNRFKDLYLSGGVVFGPASASNVSSQTLSSYEEGSWSPVLQAYSGTQPTFTHASGYTPTGVYTKVGRLVTVEFYLPNFSVSGATSGTLVIAGLPFTAGSAGSYNGPPVSAYNVNWARSGNVTLRHYANTRLGFLSNNNNGSWNWEIVSAINNSATYIVGSITYATNA